MSTPKRNVGETAWWAHCAMQQVSHPCPVCFGKRKVTLILGNDERVETPCDYCGKGFEGPRGVVEEYEWVADPKIVLIDSLSSEEKQGETTYRYYFLGGYYCGSEDLFATKEEATVRCLERSAEHAEEERVRKYHMKEYNHRTYAWHVGYHRRCAKQAEYDLKYHSDRVVICKSLAKTPVPEEAAT